MALISELKRRNVFRVGLAYLALAWLAIEVSGTLLPAFGVPDWAFRLVVILLALGFIPTLVFSWAYEITPEGLRREQEVVREESITRLTARRLDLLTIALIVAAAAFILVDRLWLGDRFAEEQPGPVAGTPEAAGQEAADAGVQPNSIAVLPFANRSANPDDVFFVDGIHDDLLTYVSQINSLKVISRTSVMEYRDTLKKIPQIARELGVVHVMEGGVQRAGDHVRINVQLIDARTDDHVWSSIYDRELTAANVFAIQSEIARAIAQALRATLTAEGERRLQTVPTHDLAALESYFMGRQLLAKRNVPAMAEAIEHFAGAVERDPEFALAYVGLADSIRLHAGYSEVGRDRWSRALSEAQAVVDRALQLDPLLGAAYAAQGSLYLGVGKHAEAEAAFQRAIELNPNYAPAYQWYGEWLGEAYSLGQSDRLEQALQLSEKAVELDPKSAIIVNDYGEVLQRGGRYNEALEQFEKSVELEPDFAPGYSRIMILKAFFFNRLDEALLSSRERIRIEPDRWQLADAHAYWHLELGDLGRAALWRDRALELAPERAVPDSAIEMALFQGDHDVLEPHARARLASNPEDSVALLALERLAWATDDPAEVRALYTKAFPGLVAESGPEVTSENLFAAVSLAAALLELGDPSLADRLLDEADRAMGAMPAGQAYRIFGFEMQPARIHALRGDRKAALDALPTVRGAGWWRYSSYWLRQDPVLETLHGEPRFQAVRDEIEAELAAQLAQVHSWEAEGILLSLPTGSADPL